MRVPHKPNLLKKLSTSKFFWAIYFWIFRPPQNYPFLYIPCHNNFIRTSSYSAGPILYSLCSIICIICILYISRLFHVIKWYLFLYRHGKGYNREYLKKKKQKKQQRFKQIEEERETEKNKWLNFHTKAAKKPGVRTKSIFASPDNLTGRVGIGTCGISGKPMTEYTPGEKWKKGG